MNAHLTDADILRTLDGSTGESESASLTLHLEECDECRDRLRYLKARSDRLQSLMNAVDEPIPAFSPPIGYRVRQILPLVAAAVVVVTLGLFISVDPLRGWIVQHSRTLWSYVSGEGETPEETLADSVPPVPRSVDFLPEGTNFSIRFARYQRTGTLELSVGESAELSASILNSISSENLLVLPNQLLISNDSLSSTDYRVIVPKQLHEITIVVEGDTIVTVNPQRDTLTRLLPLQNQY